MLKTYAATDAHIRVLKRPPQKNYCLAQSELNELKYQANRIVYLWLINGRGFWYHIKFVKGNKLIGYFLDRALWRYYPININNICRYF